jgi:membrane fusion protein, adhesin transport system
MTRSHRYADFLPDAQGVADRRHSPVAGALILVVAAAFGSMLGWSAWAEVEQVVRATGRVQPAGQVKVVNHPHGGRVAEIHVAEGERVDAGQPLVTFDAEETAAHLAELRGQLQVLTAREARLAAEARSEDNLELPLELALERDDLTVEQEQLLRARRVAQATRAAVLTKAVERRESEIETLKAELTRLRTGLGLFEQQEQAVRELAEKGLYPKLKMVVIERQVADVRGEVQKTRERLRAAEAALEEAQKRLVSLEQDHRSQVLAELAEVGAERARLQEMVRRQQARLRNLVVRSPVDGVVQGVVVTSAGQSVGSNEPLMRIVPVGGGLVIEARVANEDIGYLTPGQAATIKVRAYDFLRYGTLPGWIDRIAPDATPEPGSGELRYSIWVHTERGHLGDEPGTFEVMPGMMVDVDLRVGDRTVLSYLTDRIFLVREDAFRRG